MSSVRLALAATACFVGWLFSPLLMAPTNAGALDDIASWAMKGPARALPPPLIGVYVFRGLSPVLLADLSYAHSWNPVERSFVFDMTGPGVYVAHNASAPAYTGEFRSTSPGDYLGATFLKVFSVLRYSNTFYFNEDYTHAHVHPRFFFSERFPLVQYIRSRLREEMVLVKPWIPSLFGFGSPSWKRINFAPPSNSTPTEAHYWLHPVLTRNGDGSLKLHADGLAMAKRKLAMVSGSRLVHYK